MIKNIIFDWSGTLSDNIGCVYSAIMNVFKRVGLQPIPFEQFQKEFKLPYMDFWKRYTDKSRKELQKLYVEEIHRVGEPKIYPGVKEILKKLKQKRIRMTILSAHPKSKLDKELNDYNVRKYFAFIIGSLHDKKRVISEMIKLNGFEPNETAYVGDMVHDVETGKKAGLITVALTWGYQTKERLAKSRPHYLIDNIKKLEKII